MTTQKNYRMPEYTLKAITRIKERSEVKYSDAEIISSAVTMLETISTIWNDAYEKMGSDIYEKFDPKDDAQLVVIMKLLQMNLASYDHN